MKILPQRRSIRLKNYDYSSSGWYFVTICTQNRECLFGEIVNGHMELNNAGRMVENVWQSLPYHHSVELNAFQIMPNHVHFIIHIVGATRGSPVVLTRGSPVVLTRGSPAWNAILTGGSRPAPTENTKTLGVIVGLFKSECTKQIRRTIHNGTIMVWQRNYHEYIVRNELKLNRIRKYVKNNPQMWARDRNNPNLKI